MRSALSSRSRADGSGSKRLWLAARSDPSQAAETAAEFADEFTGRDSTDVPAWYRVSVVPSLVRRAALAALGARTFAKMES